MIIHKIMDEKCLQNLLGQSLILNTNILASIRISTVIANILSNSFTSQSLTEKIEGYNSVSGIKVLQHIVMAHANHQDPPQNNRDHRGRR